MADGSSAAGQRFSAYWDAAPDGQPAMLEKSPQGLTANEAVAWGRRRAPRVLIRTGDTEDTYFSAGAIDDEREQRPRRYPRWPGAASEHEPVVIEGYRGTVFIAPDRTP